MNGKPVGWFAAGLIGILATGLAWAQPDPPARVHGQGPGMMQPGGDEFGAEEAPEGPHAVVPDEARVRPHAPGRDYVWEEPRALAGGRVVVGFWRPRLRVGFVWNPGLLDAEGRWLPGHWRPERMRPGFVWVPGFWSNGVWIEGVWRPAARRGFAWVPGHWTPAGIWVNGQWRPARPAPRGKVWMAGYWGPGGVWV